MSEYPRLFAPKPIVLSDQLILERCPHCRIDNPNLAGQFQDFGTTDHNGGHRRRWRIYVCNRCGGVVTAGADMTFAVRETYPALQKVDEELPSRVKHFLKEALDCLHSPSASIVMSASAIDAMLKAKGYTTGNLYPRIEQAANNHLITEGMKEWAHEIRLDANDQRHADENADLPSIIDAQRIIKFAQALGEFLFVLPARIERGRAGSSTA